MMVYQKVAVTILMSDVEALKAKINGLEYVSPRNQLGGFGGDNNVTKGLKTGAFDVYGDYPDVINQEPMDIVEGRFLNMNDINANRKAAVIGQGVVDALYDKGEVALGSYIKINGVNFMVIGVYKKKSGMGRDIEEAQKQIYVPFTSFSQAFNYGDRVSWMAITADNNHSITQLKSQVFDIIKKRHRIHPEDDRAIG